MADVTLVLAMLLSTGMALTAQPSQQAGNTPENRSSLWPADGVVDNAGEYYSAEDLTTVTSRVCSQKTVRQQQGLSNNTQPPGHNQSTSTWHTRESFISQAEWSNTTDISLNDSMNPLQNITAPFSFRRPIMIDASAYLDQFHNDENPLGMPAVGMSPDQFDWEALVENGNMSSETVSPEDVAMVMKHKETALTVWQYGSPILLSTGTVGNILSVVVICRKKILHTTTSVYLLGLAAVDTASLYTGLLHLYMKNVHEYDWRLSSTASCKLHMFAGSVFLQYGAWLLVSVTLERLCAVYLPHRCREIFTKRNAAIGLTVQAIVIIAINAHYLVTHEVLKMNSGVVICAAPTNSHWHFTHYVWPWIDYSLSSLLPSLLLLLCNSAIVCRIGHAESLRRRQLHAHGTGAKMSSMTAILLTVSLVFLISTAPLSIYIIRNVALQLNADAVHRAQYSVVWAALNLLLYTNNAVNFLLYIVSGPRFRQELFKVLCVKSNTVQPAVQHNIRPTAHNKATVPTDGQRADAGPSSKTSSLKTGQNSLNTAQSILV